MVKILQAAVGMHQKLLTFVHIFFRHCQNSKSYPEAGVIVHLKR